MDKFYKPLKEIEKKWGVLAYHKLCDVMWKFQLRIEELTKSRDNWKDKYMKLKNMKGGQKK